MTPRGRLGSGAFFLDRAQGQQSSALRLRDAREARNLEALVGAIAAQAAHKLAVGRIPQSHSPIEAATRQQTPFVAQRHGPNRAGMSR